MSGKHWWGSAICATAALAASTALAQGFPNKPIKILWGYAPGSPIEVGVRAVAGEASKILGQPIIVENRPGAAGKLSTDAIKGSRGDPYVLAAYGDSLLVFFPVFGIDASRKIEPNVDYTPVTRLFDNVLVLLAQSSGPIRDLKGLVAYAKANPGKLNYASGGPGSNSQLAMELLMDAAKIEITHIPFKGSAPALNEMVSGRVDLLFGQANAKPFVDAGKFIALGATGSQRGATFPTVPTMVEAGLPTTIAGAWVALVAPPGIPPEALATLNQAFVSAMKMPEGTKGFDKLGLSVAPSTPAELTANVKADIERWTPIAKATGIKIE